MKLDSLIDSGRETRANTDLPTLNSEKNKLAGYAARFYDPNDPGTEFRYRFTVPDGTGRKIEVRERIMPGAFDQAILHDECRGMYNHSTLLGNRVPQRVNNTLELRCDDRGLWYEVELAETTAGRDTKISLERGDITGSSFVFEPRAEGGIVARQEGEYIVRELRSLRLLDVSAVDYPAYKSATAELRSFGSNQVPSDVLALVERCERAEKRSEPEPNAISLEAFRAAIEAPSHAAARGTDLISQDEIRWQLSKLLQSWFGCYCYPCEIYDSFFYFEMGDPPQTIKMGYAVEGFTVKLVGTPQGGTLQTVFVPNGAKPVGQLDAEPSEGMSSSDSMD